MSEGQVQFTMTSIWEAHCEICDKALSPSELERNERENFPPESMSYYCDEHLTELESKMARWTGGKCVQCGWVEKYGHFCSQCQCYLGAGYSPDFKLKE